MSEKDNQETNKVENNKKIQNKQKDKTKVDKTDKQKSKQNKLNIEKKYTKTDIKDTKNNTKTEKKPKKVVSTQTFVLTLVITISFCLIAILFLNLIVRNDTLVNFDWTSSKLYKLSKEAQEVIKNVDETVQISIDSRINYAQTSEILNQITKLNSKIKVIVSEPKEDDESQAFYSTIFVRAIDREDRPISFFDMNYDGALVDYKTYKQYSLFEQALVNAIISVTNAETIKNPSVAFLEGFDGPSISEEMFNLYTELRSFGMLPIALDLEKDNIPESVKIIAIVGPMEDLKQKEYDKLLAFQARGGDFIIAVTFQKKKPLPMFDKLLSSYGVKVPAGNILDYRNENRYAVLQANEIVRFYNNIVLPIPTSDNEITKDMSFEGAAPFFVFPAKIDFEPESKQKEKNLTYINHLLTSDKAVFKVDDITDQDITDKDLPSDANPNIYVLGTIADKKMSETATSTAIIYPNYFFMTDQMIRDLLEEEIILKGDNFRLAKNSFTYLHPLKEKMLDIKKPLTISPYKYETRTIGIHKTLTYLAFGIPILTVIVFGAVILYRRGYLAKYGYEYKKNNK